jgi:uncharacterized membrane protein YbhN (UPF0104 family)
MQRSSLIKVARRVLQICVPLVILAFFVNFIRGEWSQLTSHTFSWNLWLLLASFLGFVAQCISYGVIWQAILKRLGYSLPFHTSLRIYLASEFVRYIPGNVWHVLTRILWVNKYGVPRSVAFASMVIELTTKLAAGALIFALSLLFWADVRAVHSLLNGTPWLIALGIGLTLAVLVGIHPRILNGLLNIALRLLKREPIVLILRYRDILLISLYWCISWLIAGCAFYILTTALWPMPLVALPVCIGIYALAWDIGFLTFITPSGLGFREGVIAGLLALSLPFLPLALGTIIAILARLVSTLAELVCVSIAYFTGNRQIQEVQRETALATVATSGSTQGGAGHE